MYYFKANDKDETEYGPLDSDQIREWLREKRMDNNSLVRKSTDEEWRPLGQVPDWQTSAIPPERIPPAPAPAPAPASAEGEGEGEGGVSTVIPYKNAPALIAYYVGVFCIICPPLLCFPAIILGVIGLRRVKENPEVKGTAHAWIGILSGSFFLLLSIVIGVFVSTGMLQ